MMAGTIAGTPNRWRVAAMEGHEADEAACARLMRELGVPAVVAKLLCRRELTDPELAKKFLAPKLKHLHDPALLPGIDVAADRILRAIAAKQKIVIYGDYDVDGITASAILWHILRALDAQVVTYVPHRLEEGYGLNSQAIEMLANEHAQPLIVSVDCGITAVEPALVARGLGVDLIITDHHEFDPAALPDAAALVHPRLPGSRYPFGQLCGAGVAFKLAWHIARKHSASEQLPETLRNLMLDLLSLAALGTIADIVPLVDENRVLATFGLGQIKRTGIIGLNALIDASRLRDESIDAYHVGFVLGPRLNACGRMGHAKEAVQLLTTANAQEAGEIAKYLSRENDNRRATERQIAEEATAMVSEAGYDDDACRAIVLAKEGWHAGVVGIVASRMVERFRRPAVVLAITDGEAHGSARSIDGFSIHEAFAACSEHLTKWGGHAMAAGLRLDANHVEAFRNAMLEYVNARLTPEDLTAIVEVDLPCAMEDVSLEVFEQLRRLAPFGRGNPTPVLMLRNVRLTHAPMRMGQRGRHLSLTLGDHQRAVRAVWFGAGDQAEQLAAGMSLDVAFEPKVSTWQGRKRVELHVCDVRPAR